MDRGYSSRLGCPGCSRKFRGTDSLVTHLSRNPGHGVYEQWLGNWVVKEHTVETFHKLSETPDSRSIQVSHDTSSNSVRVDGATATAIDTTPVTDRITGDVQYELRGAYLIVRVQRAPRQTC